MAENGESRHVIGFASGDCGWMGLGHGNLRPKIEFDHGGMPLLSMLLDRWSALQWQKFGGLGL